MIIGELISVIINELERIAMNDIKPKDIIELGLVSGKIDGKLSDAIKNDILSVGDDLSSPLTMYIDAELKNGNTEVKKFVRTKLQTLIKDKSMQKSLLNDNHKSHSLTIKKVNKPMVELGLFDETELGQYKIITEKKKEKQQQTIIEKLIKFMDSNELFTGDVRELLDDIDGGQLK